MKQYIDLVKTVLSEGTLKPNRTGVDTLSYFSYPFRHDLKDGFPLLTTKKMSEKLWHSLVQELLWFMSGENHIRNFREKSKIWNAWANENGNVGPIYGVQWTRWKSEKLVFVSRKVCHPDYDKERKLPITCLLKQDSNLSSELQQTFTNTAGSSYKVINVAFKDIRRGLFYRIQFARTGYIPPFGVRRDVILSGQIKDVYEPSVNNIGYLGEEASNLPKEIRNNIKKTWGHMLERCYNKQCKEYQFYGEKGIEVCRRWHCFADFLHDVQRLPNWQEKIDNPSIYQLDKDYYASTTYAPNTCVWLSKSDNIRYNSSKPVIAKSPHGQIRIYLSREEALQDFDIDKKRFYTIIDTDEKYDGWQFTTTTDLCRKQLPINQLKGIISEIKSNPNSRRLVLSAWNPADISDMVLPPCHCFSIFNVQDGRLCLSLTQRSCDLGLGVPFNIASYALLTHVVAQETGLEPGVLSIMFVDAHIYYAEKGSAKEDWDHSRILSEQIKREPLDLPSIKIAKKSIWDLEFEDFELNNYKSHDLLKMKVAV